ncbi:hypothetical protein BPUTSESOX_1760 [uncultured Gammaproteobacteria bacterium]|jgi:cytochrome c553|uniref:hypothetical protein n=1 Tax=thiotrophic endosymbiont of Bathymodiolus puteoserpentis (Logatchev) TaxID=343240 RepID=UPI0010B09B19|nr:hypothetical protein [thiotrophic endosymbiont of Bathymodiolus puteoserpentis (Logatchev)]CAC9575316.1 hypothetical protein [uncultured Gammaproteobacteria bacterium]SSC09588.1 hypothetical protein BPUTEOSOX_342 [thiotrophic endosymbiont of Bathymodiolus puteoserpentis (Logatchev)]VVH51726.1 hypothetical protein BPUTSESOX_1760 [uncultured Gammaproteobacteria bacterium]
MKKLLLIITLLSTTAFANEGKAIHNKGKELHNESCIACHMITHDDDFYTRKNRKMDTLPKLTGQVSKCVQAFSIGWFPDEEKSVVEYLNKKYYQFKK